MEPNINNNRFVWLPDDIFWIGSLDVAADYNPNHAPAGSPEGGQFTSGEGSAGGKGEAHGQLKGYSSSARLDEHGVIHTSSVYDAQRALFENRRVELAQPKMVSTLIKRLGETAKEMQEAGEKAPLFNLCNVSIEGTNLFCSENKGIPRVKMPVIPAKKTKDFIKYLKSQGYEVEKGHERAENLRATQNEIDGAKVAIQMNRIEEDGFYKRLVISKDDYILDGHHTWAGQLGLDAKHNDLHADKSVKVARVNISITKLLEEGDKWTASQGIKKKAAGSTDADGIDFSLITDADLFGDGDVPGHEFHGNQYTEARFVSSKGMQEAVLRNEWKMNGDKFNTDDLMSDDHEYGKFIKYWNRFNPHSQIPDAETTLHFIEGRVYAGGETVRNEHGWATNEHRGGVLLPGFNEVLEAYATGTKYDGTHSKPFPGVKKANEYFLEEGRPDRAAFASKEDFESYGYDAKTISDAAEPDAGTTPEQYSEEAAGVMFQDPHGRMLLMRRSDTGEWAFPAGGLEENEPPLHAAQREAAEETGYPGNHRAEKIDERITRGVKFHTFRQPVGATFDPILNGEHTEHGWFPPSDLPDPLHPGVAATLQKTGFMDEAAGHPFRDWNPDQPRVPAGSPDGGQFSSGKGGSTPRISDAATLVKIVTEDRAIFAVPRATGVGVGDEAAGHPFRGNQYKEGESGGGKQQQGKRVYNGQPVNTRIKLTKLETCAIGEQAVIDYAKANGIKDMHSLNVGMNNYPIDLQGDHIVVEVKAGLVSNTRGAQQWNAKIGQPGVKEQEWLSKISASTKAAWNKNKDVMILARKENARRALSRKHGTNLGARTATLIINPDTKSADLYIFEGFHKRIGWNSPQAKTAFVKTIKYK